MKVSSGTDWWSLAGRLRMLDKLHSSGRLLGCWQCFQCHWKSREASGRTGSGGFGASEDSGVCFAGREKCSSPASWQSALRQESLVYQSLGSSRVSDEH